MSNPEQSPPAVAGIPILETKVARAWVDYNGHMGDFAYGIVFSDAATAYMDRIGLGAAYREASSATLYTLDSRIGYLKECHEGAALAVELVVLEADAKRMHIFMCLRNAQGAELALCEQVLMHVARASGTPRAAPFPPEVQARLTADAAAHSGWVRPQWLERRIGLPRR
ncbi:thioesterase family protein [Xanthobacter autotrophicus DSM 431]|uniref:thioesterase family protein n=1 Tax=Xanthobacter nonsaccharivorans TaxID=3119912 RepID=UPI003729A173